MSASLALGTNAYGLPASTVVIGEPEITGGLLVAEIATAMLNAGSVAMRLTVAHGDRNVREGTDVRGLRSARRDGRSTC